jgi:ankyrin repeat protein
MTPLHWAALAPERRDDAATVIELLLAAGADGLHARDEWGRTPVDIASSRGDEAALAALRKAHTNVP